jgi:hypothetical protein
MLNSANLKERMDKYAKKTGGKHITSRVDDVESDSDSDGRSESDYESDSGNAEDNLAYESEEVELGEDDGEHGSGDIVDAFGGEMIESKVDGSRRKLTASKVAAVAAEKSSKLAASATKKQSTSRLHTAAPISGVADATAPSASALSIGASVVDGQLTALSELKKAFSALRIGSDLLGATAPGADNGVQLSIGGSVLSELNVKVDGDNPCFGSICLPVQVGFRGTLREFASSGRATEWYLNPGYISAAACKLIAEKLVRKGEAHEGMAARMVELSRSARVAIQSVKPKLAYSQLPFDVCVDIPRLTCFVGADTLVPGLRIPSDAGTVIDVSHVPMGIERPWKDLRREIETFAPLSPEKVAGKYMYRPPEADIEGAKYFCMLVKSPLAEYVRPNQKRFLQKEIMDKPEVIVDGKYIKITPTTYEKIRAEVSDRHANLPLQQNLCARLIRADGESWSSTSFAGQVQSAAEANALLDVPFRVWLTLDVQLLVYVDAIDL